MITNYQVFTEDLMKEYLHYGFGSMNKKEIDMLVLKHIVNEHVTSNNGELDYFKLSKELKITVTKLKSQIKELQARYYYDVYEKGEFNKRLIRILNDKHYKIEGKNIILAPQDAMFSQFMEMYAFQLNTFFDGSFNPDIIKISIEDFIKIISIAINGVNKLNEFIQLLRNSVDKDTETHLTKDEKDIILTTVNSNNVKSGKIDWYKIIELVLHQIPWVIRVATGG